MIFVLSISMTVAMSRFGFGVLEDNFVATLNTTYKSSAQFMCFYGLLNFYLYTMAYVYSPSGRIVHGEQPSQTCRTVHDKITNSSIICFSQNRASPRTIQHFQWSMTQMKMSFMVRMMKVAVHSMHRLERQTTMIVTENSKRNPRVLINTEHWIVLNIFRI